VAEPAISATPLADYFRDWLAAQRDRVRDTTLDTYGDQIRHLCRAAEGLTLEHLSGVQVCGLLRSLEGAGVPPSMRRECGMRLRQALKRAYRLGQLVALTWDDYDPVRGTLAITKACRLGWRQPPRETKTRGSRRVLSIGWGCRRALAAHRRLMDAEGHGSPWMFPCLSGLNASKEWNEGDWWGKLLVKAGLPPIRPHDLRHTCATLLLLAGVGIHEVAQRLGHASPALVLKTYGHVLPAMRDRVTAAIDGILCSSTGSSRLPCGLRELRPAESS
jgi:integrase